MEDDFDTAPTFSDTGVVVTKTVSFHFQKALDSETGILGHTDTEDGQYLSLGGYSYGSPNNPIEPLYFRDITRPGWPVRSVVLRSATVYTVTSEFNPVVATPHNEYTEEPEPTFTPFSDAQYAWYPPQLMGCAPFPTIRP